MMCIKSKERFKRILPKLGIVAFLMLAGCGDEAYDRAPRSSQTSYRRGNAYLDEGDYDRAISEFTKTVEIYPKFASAYINRGFAYNAKGQYDLAISDYSRAIEIDSGDALTYFNRGNAYFDKGDYDRAIRDYNKAIEINPRDAKAYFNRGFSYDRKEEYVKAWEDVNKAQSLGYQVQSSFLDGLAALAIVASTEPAGELTAEDYNKCRDEIMTTYKMAQPITTRANELFFMKDGEGVYTQNADESAQLYKRSTQQIEDTIRKNAACYQKFPVVFVDLNYLRAENAKGLATIYFAKIDTENMFKYYKESAAIGEEVRMTISKLTQISSKERESLEPMMKVWLNRCMETDGRVKQLLTTVYGMLSLHYSMAGDNGTATKYHEKALQLIDDPKKRAEMEEAFKAVLKR